MAVDDVMQVIGLLEEDIRKLAEIVDRLPDMTDRDAERRKEASQLVSDFQKHLAVLKAFHG